MGAADLGHQGKLKLARLVVDGGAERTGYGLFGGFKGMARIDAGARSQMNAVLGKKGRSANLPGGGTQFYIPNLTVGHITNPVFSAL
jgi:hypothetical protein